MANIFVNNKNLGPIIDAKTLPSTDVNPNAIYRLATSKFDITNGHGKDSTACPVGYYKPAAGTYWTGSQVIRGSYGQYMDGYYDCPVSRMRRGNPDANWDPVPCTAEESSGLWYYDYERDDVFFAWNPVGTGKTNFYSPDQLDKTLGLKNSGIYTNLSGIYTPLNDTEACTFLGVGNDCTITNSRCVKVGHNTYRVNGALTTSVAINANTSHLLITNFKIGPTAKSVVQPQPGYGYTDVSGLICTFLIKTSPDGDAVFSFSQNCAASTALYFGATIIVKD